MIDFELSIASNLSFLFQFEVLLFFFLLEYHMLRCVLRSTFTSSSCFTTCLQTRLLHLVFSSIIPCFVACLQTRLLLHHVLLRVYTIFTASRGFYFPLWYSNSGSTVGVASKALGILIVVNYLRRSATLNFEHTCASELEHDHY